MTFSSTQQVNEVFVLARKKTLELNLDEISSEILLSAIIDHGSNDGLDLLKKNGTNMGKLNTLLVDRFKVIQKSMPFDNVLPKMSSSLRAVLVFAQVIAVGKPVSAESLVFSLFRTSGCVASQLLKESEYTEEGAEKRKVLGGRVSNTKTPALNAFSVDLTIQAQEGKLDPVIGRDFEIKHLIEILARRKKNNPALIGEPGVGKTAIVEGLATRIAFGDVPVVLRNKKILALDLNSVVAGTQYRGQFEERMQRIIRELKHNSDIIIFIDEMHTLMGAGGTEGTGDAGNIIKPALSRGQIRCIGATTSNEYRRHIEKNGALDRRFQKVTVDAPTLEETVQILEQIKPVYELFHGVQYNDVIPTIVDLADRYVPDRYFPDKAIDVLDEAGALVSLNAAQERTVTPQVTADSVRQVISKISGIPVTTLTITEREKLKNIGEEDASTLNGTTWIIGNVTANTFELTTKVV